MYCCNIYLYLSLGLATIVLNPASQTTCVDTPVSFRCVISDQSTITWLVNGRDSLYLGLPDPVTEQLTTGAQSSLTLPGSFMFAGASVICSYPSFSSPPAFLSVLGTVIC